MVVPVSQLYSYDTSEGGGVGNMKRREPLHWVGKADKKAVKVQPSALVLSLFQCIKHSDLCRERWGEWALKTASCVRQVRLLLWIRISAYTQSSRYRCCARNGADIITWSVEIPRVRSGSEEENNITEVREGDVKRQGKPFNDNFPVYGLTARRTSGYHLHIMRSTMVRIRVQRYKFCTTCN